MLVSTLFRGRLVLTLFGALAWACTRVPLEEQVLGKYVLDTDQAHDELVLYPAALYVHSYMPIGASAIVDSGRWRFEPFDDGHRLVFTDFSMRARNRTFPGMPQSAGTWVVPLERTITGKLQLEVDDDLGWYYVKQQ